MSRKIFRLFFFVVLVWLLHMGSFAKRGWLDWRRIVQQSREMEDKIASARKSREDIVRETDQLQTDTAQQERLVRQVLGYIRADETVIEFE